MSFYDHVLGCLAGLAVGDALGMPTEFLSPERIANEFGWVHQPVKAPAGHPHHAMQPGQITDDTGQTLAVAHAYTDAGKLTAKAVAKELLSWADSQGKFLDCVIGPSTKAALEALGRGEKPEKTGLTGKTNGASYRVVIAGLVQHQHPDQLIRDVVTACLPSHGTAPAISGAMAVAMAVAEACREASTLGTILSAAKQGAMEGRKHGAWSWDTPLEKRIELAERLVKENREPRSALRAVYDYVGVDLAVSESVAAAFGLLLLAEGDPMAAVVYGANIGGDTDTIAAIAGAIGGAWKGIRAIDAGILATVEKVNSLDLAAEAARLVAIAKG
jgi:ADP-ribosylglycohydrolase